MVKEGIRVAGQWADKAGHCMIYGDWSIGGVGGALGRGLLERLARHGLLKNLNVECSLRVGLAKGSMIEYRVRVVIK